jgi:hypothetical protein
MASQGQRDLVADAVERVERGHRLLEDHRDLDAAVAVQRRRAQADQFLPTVAHRAFGPAIRRKEAHHGHHGLALAEPDSPTTATVSPAFTSRSIP